jgi:hypothetical protein
VNATKRAFPTILGLAATANCLYFQGEKMPKKGAFTLSERPKWLVGEKDKRKAKEVDGAWLKDYVEKKGGARNSTLPNPPLTGPRTAGPGALCHFGSDRRTSRHFCQTPRMNRWPVSHLGMPAEPSNVVYAVVT